MERSEFSLCLLLCNSIQIYIFARVFAGEERVNTNVLKPGPEVDPARPSGHG